MAPPEWLPPLNSHDNFAINVVASQLESPHNDPTLREQEFRICIIVTASFFSDEISNQRIFGGLFMFKTYSLPCSLVRSILRCRECGESIANMLNDVLIPFELDELTWGEKHLRDQFTQGSSKFNRIEILQKIQSFLYRMSNKYYNLMHNVLPFNLEVSKKITVPDSEFKAWCSWYDEKRRVDPDFATNYLEAISRPRTERELYEENLEFIAATRTSMVAMRLHHARIVADNDKASTFCSICLEEMQIGSLATRLPCSHIFHGECIGRWILESHRCPLCRYTLPISV